MNPEEGETMSKLTSLWADTESESHHAEGSLRTAIIAALRSVFDPEIPVNIYDLGLIYDLDVDAGNNVHIKMTLTAPACPVAEIIPEQVRAAVAKVDAVNDVQVELVWDPPWTQNCMSEEARLELGML